MAHPADTREKLRRAYIFGALTLEQTAHQQGVSLPTARRWKQAAREKQDDWDKLRSANLIAGGGIESAARAVLVALVCQCQATTEAISTDSELSAQDRVELLASLADAFSKATSASKKILPETDKLAIAISVIQSLGAHVAEKYPALRGDFVEVLESYSKILERDFG